MPLPFARCAVLTAAVIAPSALAQNLLINGSFESWPTRVPSYVTIPAGSTEIPGWTVTGTSVDLVGGWQQGSGLLSLDLDGTPGSGGVEQTFATVPGQWYSVEFLLAGNPECGNPIKSIRVDAAGSSNTLSFNTTGHSFDAMGWEPHSWCFQAVASVTTLAITSLTTSGSNCGPALDAVVVEVSVPPLVGDLDCNGIVNGADLAILLGAWGPCGSCLGCRTDLNGDCTTDAADLALLLGSWMG